MKCVRNFKKWALKECSEFENRRKEAYVQSGMGGIDGRYHWHSYGNKIIILDMETGKTGIAQCREGDEFSSIIGVGVAWARLKGEEIPIECKTTTITKIKTLKIGDKFIIVNDNNDNDVYCFVGRYNFESIDKCFCAIGKELTAFHPDTTVIKL